MGKSHRRNQRLCPALSKAAAQAQRTSRDIGRAFSELGYKASQTFGAFGEFNPIISKLGFALGTAGEVTSKAMKEFGKLPGALGPIAALGVGAGAGMASLGIGILEVAAHAAEAAVKMQHLAESAGVPVQVLSGLSFAAKAEGVDIETLAGGLEKMSKSAEKAATAPKGTATAYSRLGISLRDFVGNVRPVEDIFIDLADKFSKIEDGVDKTALAIQIFGKGGAALIPVLNQGRDAIQEVIDYAVKVGAILSGPAAEGAEKFERNMVKVKMAANGAQNSLMVQMLPSLQYLSEMFAKTGVNGKSWSQNTAEGLANISKLTISFIDIVVHGLEQIGIFLQFIGGALLGTLEMIGSVVTATGHALAFDFSGAKKELSAGLDSFTRTFTDFFHDTKRTWTDSADFINGVWSKLKPPEWDIKNLQFPQNFKFLSHAPPAQNKAAGGSVPKDDVAEMIAKLQSRATAELGVAAAIEKTTSAMLLAKAAAEAAEKIDETRIRLKEREKALLKELAEARGEGENEQAGTGSAQHAAKLQPELAAVRSQLAELEKAAPRIKQLYAEIASAEFGAKSSEELIKFTIKTDEGTAAHNQMAAAFDQGPEAVQQAQVDAKIAPYIQMRKEVGELLSALQAIGAPAEEIAKLQTNFDNLGTSIDRARVSLKALSASEIGEKVKGETLALKGEAEAYALIADAALKSGKEQREAAAEAATQIFKSKPENRGATPDVVQGVYQNELDKLEQEHAKTVANIAAQYDLNAAYAKQIEELREIEAFLEKQGGDTTGVRTKIAETETQHVIALRQQTFDAQNEEIFGLERIYDAQRRNIEQWDVAANKVGDFGQKFRAVINEIEMDGDNFTGKFFDAMKKGFDGVEDELAKFIVTGKSNFKQLFQSIEQEIVKAELKKGFSVLFKQVFGGPGAVDRAAAQDPGARTPPFLPEGAGKAGGIIATVGKILGIDSKAGISKPDGSQGNPFYVLFASGTGGEPGGATNSSGDLFGKSGLDNLPLFNSNSSSPFGISGLDNLPLTNANRPSSSDSSSPFGASGLDNLPLFNTNPAASGNNGSSSNDSSSVGSGITGAISGLTSSLGGLLGNSGSGSRPTGSRANPFYVISAAGGGKGTLGTILGAASSIFGAIAGAKKGGDSGGGGGSNASPGFGAEGGLIKGPGTSTSDSIPHWLSDGEFVVKADAVRNFGVKNLETINSLSHKLSAHSISSSTNSVHNLAHTIPNFGGFREMGGNVTPGHAYIVGEKRPELFVPKTAGTILPSVNTKGGNNQSPAVYHTEIHLHGVQDADSFNRSKPQLMAEFQRQAGIAHSRNRAIG